MDSFNDGVLTLKSKMMSFDYYVYNSDALESFKINPKFIDILTNVPTMVNCSLDQQTIKKILDVGRLFDLDKIIISPSDKDGKVMIKVTQIRKNSSAAHMHKKYA